MTGTSAGLRAAADRHGIAELPENVDLAGVASGVWRNTGCQVTLPAAGTYQLDAMVRASLGGSSPLNAWISARLFDVSNGVMVPEALALVVQANVSASAGSVTFGQNVTGPIVAEYTVGGPTLIRIQVARTIAVGSPTSARIHGQSDGQTRLRYRQIA
ncbi:hypothetical protein [Streptomyces cadmiisoli]|uniref:hypothetical protein n=1 Tax=Streptomyces cadmiisoli TaxID=2184053 RepID=UPI003653C1D3